MEKSVWCKWKKCVLENMWSVWDEKTCMCKGRSDDGE